MDKIIVITDSNSGISPAVASNMGIGVIAMPFVIDGETYYEKEDISDEKFYEALEKKLKISTSQPAVGSLYACWQKYLEHYDQLIYIPMSSALSNSYETAVMLASQPEFMDKVYVVDNRRISLTQTESVKDALYLIKKGYHAKTIKEILDSDAKQSVIYLMVNDLDYLKRGGRISKTASIVGTTLNIKPILSIKGEKLEFYGRAHGMKQAIKKMEDALENDMRTTFAVLKKTGNLKVGLAYTKADEKLIATVK
ncbi:MAG: DegV family protein, partial [Erysipelotrichaceae bacterium]|nr:DegV family protein [Erysipelotrichaceae bacterium]